MPLSDEQKKFVKQVLGVLDEEVKDCDKEISVIDNNLSSASNYKTELTGKALYDWVNSPRPKREPIAEGFLYDKSCLMLYADPGLGKSCVSLQAALELSAGVPLFGSLPVTRTYKVFYIMKERPVEEAGERIEEMQKSIPWIADNLYLDDKMQLLNFARERDQNQAIGTIERFGAEIVIIDPIIGGLTRFDEETVLILNNFLTRLQHTLGTTHWLNHHTVKSKKDSDGSQKSNPFYGSQFLEAHVTGSYWLKKGKSGLIMERQKCSHSNMLDRLEFEYDPELYVSRLLTDSLPNEIKLNNFINFKKGQNKPFYFDEALAYVGCATRTLRRLLGTPQKEGVIHRLSPDGVRAYYGYPQA